MFASSRYSERFVNVLAEYFCHLVRLDKNDGKLHSGLDKMYPVIAACG